MLLTSQPVLVYQEGKQGAGGLLHFEVRGLEWYGRGREGVQCLLGMGAESVLTKADLGLTKNLMILGRLLGQNLAQ